MNEEKKQVSLDKQIRQNYRKHFLSKTSLIAILALFVVLSLVAAYFIPITLLFTSSLIILPLLLGFIAENISANSDSSSITRMMMGFRIYYSRNFFGIFHIIEGFLKALIIYVASSNIVLIVLHFSISLQDPTYSNLINSILVGRNIEDLNKNIQALLENPTFILIENISQIVAFGLASYMVIHHVLTHSIKVYYNLLGKKIMSAPAVNLIHRRAFTKFRKYFYRDYYSSIWYMIPLFIALYVGGAIVGMVVLNRTGLESAVIGLFVSSIICIFLLPIIYDTVQIIFSIYGMFYIQSAMELSEPLKHSYGEKYPFSKEEKEMIDKALEEFNSILNNKSKDDKNDEEN